MIRIDGSKGEGGGQILRTSVSLATALGKPVEIYNIRANRNNPGLRPQHLSSIRTIAEISQSETQGLSLNSTKINILPNKVLSKNMHVDIGTAGSITLLMQSVIQAISLCGKKFQFSVRGGTDVNWSPSADYFRRLVVPVLETLGFSISMSIIKRGFFPKGNGQIDFEIQSPKKLNNINYELELPSAQVKSAFLLSALNIDGITSIVESEKTRDHTELMMRHLGAVSYTHLTLPTNREV